MLGLFFSIIFFVVLWGLSDLAEKYYTGQISFKRKKDCEDDL